MMSNIDTTLITKIKRQLRAVEVKNPGIVFFYEDGNLDFAFKQKKIDKPIINGKVRKQYTSWGHYGSLFRKVLAAMMFGDIVILKINPEFTHYQNIQYIDNLARLQFGSGNFTVKTSEKNATIKVIRH